jgi:hypothetical protein
MNGNTKRVERVQGLRRSGAAGSHGDRRLKRQKTRSARKNSALREFS